MTRDDETQPEDAPLTVQRLIDFLSTVEDKSAEVLLEGCCGSSDCWATATASEVGLRGGGTVVYLMA